MKYSTDILDIARHWYGYGRWDAKYWFIGPEPGMDSPVDDLDARCKAWIDCGRGDLVDCKKHHFGFGETKWHREVPAPPTQSTWRQLIRLLLTYRSGTAPHIDDIRSYQQKHWGMEDDETCVIELSSLAAPTLGGPMLFLEQRIKEIREKIFAYHPAFVVMYGKGQQLHWRAIAGGAFGPNNLVKMGSTTAAFALHPVSHGTSNDYWVRLAQKLRDEIG